MGDPQWTKIKDIFATALETPEAGRAALLELHCGNDSALRQAVEKLLGAHTRAEDCLLTGEAAEGGGDERRDPPIPQWLGAYEICERLGEGGFGVVYRARQGPPLDRDVALKILKRGMDTEQVLNRFEQERRALVRLDHPSIARIFDAGAAPDGRPYFVMELVSGKPVVDFCEEEGLSVRQRLELFAHICHAVHHAHQRGIIHRDLKPSNVLVTRVDGRVVPKIIDFGIAKAISDDIETQHTVAGLQVGTPRYMSPEQRGGGGVPDIRIDVYALGVLLCEALTGDVPFPGEDGTGSASGDSDSRRTALRAERPSKLAARGTSDVAHRAPELRGDVDRIVLKAAAPDPLWRYASAEAMADDLRRYLDGFPVQASVPTRWYVIRKLIGRHRLASAFALLAVVSLVLNGIALIHGLRQAEESRAETERLLELSEAARTQADAVSTFVLEDMIATLDTDLTGGGEPTVVDLLRHSAQSAPDALADDPALQVKLLRRVGEAQRTLTDFAGASDTFAAAAGAAEAAYGGSAAETLELRMDALICGMSAQRLEGIEETIEEIVEDATASLGPDHLTTLRAELHAAHIVWMDDSVGKMRSVLSRLEDRDQETSPVYLEALRYLGVSLVHAEDADAVEILQTAVSLSRERYGATHTQTLDLELALGKALGNSGEMDRGEALLRDVADRALKSQGVGNVYYREAHQQLANFAYERGQYGHGVAFARKAVESNLAMNLAGTAWHSLSLSLVGRGCYGLGQFDEALEAYQESMAIRIELEGVDGARALRERTHTAECLLALERYEEVEATVLPLLEHAPIGHLYRSRATMILATALEKSGAVAEARARIVRELSLFPEGLTPPSEMNAWLLEHPE